MNWTKKIFFFLIPFIIIIFGLEFGSRLIIKKNQSPEIFYSSYNPNELDNKIPFVIERNGSECVQIKNEFNWNPLWGYSARDLNLDCAKKHFSNKTFNVIFLGGSAMANAEAPNYLTNLDYLSTKNFTKIRSLNLSESGSRHVNMSIRLQRELINLNTDLVIFFEGFNEFNSIRYGGSPKDDFYWTATGNVRMHEPFKFYLEKLIETSAFFELALLRTNLYQSSRVMTNKNIDDEIISEAANIYLNDLKNTKNLCYVNNIDCLFIIQPHIFGSKIKQHLEIIDIANHSMPFYQTIHEKGYELIISLCGFCIDASKILNNKPDTFIDPVHFSKNGSIIVANYLEEIIESYYLNKFN